MDEIIIPELEEILDTNELRRPWTDTEVAQLRHYYGKVPTLAIADAMGRSLRAIQNKATAIGLRWPVDKI